MTSVHRWDDTRIYHRMCRSLARNGHEVHLVAPRLTDAPRISPDGVTLHLVEQATGRVGRVLGTARAAAHLGLSLQPDILHFHDPELLLYLSQSRIPTVYDAHEDYRLSVKGRYWVPSGIRRLAARAVGWFEDRSSRRVSAIVAAHPPIARRFATHPHLVVVENFPELGEDPLVHAGTRAPVAGHFVYVGGLSAGRGVEEMVTAIGRVGSPAVLSLAGPWEHQTLREHMRRRNEWSAVEERGVLGRPEMYGLLLKSVAGLCVLQPIGSYVDATPTKLFEYMLAGLPVIASHFPRWKEIIEAEQCGLVVDPRSVEELVRAMQWVMTHPIEAEQMGQRGRTAVLTRYGWESQFTKLIELYNDLRR